MAKKNNAATTTGQVVVIEEMDSQNPFQMFLVPDAIREEATSMGIKPIIAVEGDITLPDGQYACRIVGTAVVIGVPAADGSINTEPFSAIHGFKLNANRDGIELIPNAGAERASRKEFADVNREFGVMLEVVAGKYAGKFIPLHFFELGYCKRADFDDAEWMASGYEELGGYVCERDAETGLLQRVVSDSATQKMVNKSARFLGSVFSDAMAAWEKAGKPDGVVFDQILMDYLVKNGHELHVNVILKKQDFSKRAEYVGCRKFNIDSIDHKVDESDENDAAIAPISNADAIPE